MHLHPGDHDRLEILCRRAQDFAHVAPFRVSRLHSVLATSESRRAVGQQIYDDFDATIEAVCVTWFVVLGVDFEAHPAGTYGRY